MNKLGKYARGVCLGVFAATLLLSSAYAAGSGLINVKPQKISATTGEQVLVDIDIENNPGFCAAQIEICYDADVITLSSVSEDSIATQAGAWLSVKDDDNGQISVAIAGLNPVSKDGTIVQLSFLARSSGTATISVNVEKIADIDEKDLPVTAGTSASITVSGTTVRGGAARDSFSSVVLPGTETETTTATVTFSDVPEGHWAYKSIQTVVSKGLFLGVENNKFEPSSTMTRGMIATVLCRYAKGQAQGEADFSDVSSTAWYADGVAWAYENGIVVGVSKNSFAPNSNITREQLAVMLYRYSGSPKVSTSGISKYADGNSVSSWAKDALAWANTNGLMIGSTENKINPKGNATRAEAATIFSRYMKMEG